MVIEDPFPPVDPIVSLPPVHPVVPRQRRFSEKTRRLVEELNREKRELAQQEPQNRSNKRPPKEPPPSAFPEKGIDRLA